MKKLLALLLALTMLMVVFTSCNTNQPQNVSSDNISTGEEDIGGEDDPYFEPEDPVVDPEPEIEEENLSPVMLRANNILLGEDQEYIQSALEKDANGKIVANNYRLKQFIKKLRANKSISLVFFGAQNIAADGGYTERFTAWIDAETTGNIDSYECGLPGVTSEDAVYRVKHDILDRNPDLVFIDLTVVDNFGGGAKNRAPYYENIIRRVLAESNAAVVIISNAAAEGNSYRQNASNPDPMITAAEYHKEIAEFYNLPFIDMQNATWDIVSLLVDKRPYGQVPVCNWPVFGMTANHLSDTGHKNLAEMMKALILNVEKETVTDKAPNYGNTANENTFLHKNNSYMNYDYMDAMDIYYTTDVVGMGTLKENAGYSLINERNAALSQWSKRADYNGSNQFFQAFRPLLSEPGAVTLESAPIIINLPEVTKENKANLHIAFEEATGGKAGVPFSLYRYTCYDKNGKIIGGQGKVTSSPFLWSETPQDWTYTGQTIKLLEGTVQVKFEIYCAGGYMRLYGIGRTQEITGRTNANY